MTERNNKTNPLEIMIGFDPREELDRAIQQVKFYIAPLYKNIFIRSPEEETRRNKEQLSKTLAQIDLSQQRYIGRLNSASKSGAISKEDYIKAKMDASVFGPFDRLKREVRDAYEGK